MKRRSFIKNITLGGATLALAACKKKVETLTANDAPADALTEGTMTYRTGVHGEKVSLLGYGCMRWPTVSATSARDSSDEIDQEMVNKLVDYAIEHGVNYFDTSPAYCKGQSERVTGIALARHERSKIYIATKLSNFSPSTWSYEKSVAMYHNSLKMLQTDYIDYYLLHGIGMGDDGMGAMKARYFDNGIMPFLLKEREKGNIRNLGFSYHGDIKCFDYLLSLHDEIHWDFVQIQHNYVDWHYAKQINTRNTNSEYLYGECAKRHIPIVIMEPLLGGRLATQYEWATQALQAREPQRSIASWAFRYAGTELEQFPSAPNHSTILTVLSGMTYMQHLQDNLQSFSPLKPVSKDDLELLETIARGYAQFPIIPCTACQYCMPCPYGLDIPGIFFHYNNCLQAGMIESDRMAPEYRALRKKYLDSYNEQIERERQADHCTGCNKCLAHCPQGIEIPTQMRRIDAFETKLKNDIK